MKLPNDQCISMQPIIQFMLDTSVAIIFFFFFFSKVTVTDFTQSKLKTCSAPKLILYFLYLYFLYFS